MSFFRRRNRAGTGFHINPLSKEADEDCGDSGTPGMIRVSFGIYNTEEEVDEFLNVLAEAIPAAKEYVKELIEDMGEETQAFDPSF